MFTPKIISKSLNAETNIITLEVDYVNDTDGSIIKQFPKFGTDQTAEMIKWHLKNRAESLSKGIAEVDRIVEGDVDLASVTGEFRPPEIIEAETWLRKVNRLEKFDRLITLGVLSPTNKVVVDLKADIVATGKPAYLNFL